MAITEILASIDLQIASLKQARALLSDGAAVMHKAGRPAKTLQKAITPAKAAKRVLSAEGRRRIAEAQKKRWAAQRKAAADAQK